MQQVHLHYRGGIQTQTSQQTRQEKCEPSRARQILNCSAQLWSRPLWAAGAAHPDWSVSGPYLLLKSFNITPIVKYLNYYTGQVALCSHIISKNVFPILLISPNSHHPSSPHQCYLPQDSFPATPLTSSLSLIICFNPYFSNLIGRKLAVLFIDCFFFSYS